MNGCYSLGKSVGEYTNVPPYGYYGDVFFFFFCLGGVEGVIHDTPPTLSFMIFCYSPPSNDDWLEFEISSCRRTSISKKPLCLFRQDLVVFLRVQSFELEKCQFLFSFGMERTYF